MTAMAMRGVRPVRAAVAALCALALLAGCATPGGGSAGSGGGSASALDSAVGRCVAAIAGGAVLGALLGAATGGGRRIGYGAAGGAAVGGVACAVLTALDQQDKQRIRQAQIEAVSLNETRTLAYAGSDGRQRAIVISPREAPAEPQTAGRLCRMTEGRAAIAGAGEVAIPEQRICRSADGDWLPA